MTVEILRRTIATMIALAAVSACLAGCASDLGAATGTTTAPHQMRYYGGPKSPMWPSQ
jgi:Spy/CpxP family protein refolding chaperone